MAHYRLGNAAIGLASERPAAANPNGNTIQAATALYIELDTGLVKVSTGSSWTTIGTLGSPGVAGDNANGQTIAGSLTVGGEVDAANVVLSGPGGATSTHVATQQADQTGYLYEGVGSDTLTKFSVGVDGEVVTEDDVLAPLGTVKGATLAFAPTGTTGAPVADAHNAGEMIMDSAGAIFVCVTGGTPGTWKTATLT